MGQFGEELRKERMSRGVALETISEKTKVVTRYLSALEDSKFDVLPGGILSKGIVRSYARTVGLDETAWVERFMAATQDPAKQASENDWVEFASNISRSRPRSEKRSHAGLRRAGLVVLFLILAGLGWVVWQYTGGQKVADAALQHPVTSAVAAAHPQ